MKESKRSRTVKPVNDGTRARSAFGRQLAVGAVGVVVAGVIGWCVAQRKAYGIPDVPLLHQRVTDGRLSIPYAVYLPPGYSPAKKWPVILFLHGFRERGGDGISQTRGIAGFVRLRPEQFPCLLVIPQMPRSRVRWSGEVNDLALRALETVVRRYHGDQRRLYLTGCSMGGGGCWRIAAAHPRLFAAVMPLCGHTEPARQARALTALPIWAFHGGADPLVTVSYSRSMVKAIREAGGTHIRYTEYPGVRHNCWDRTYSDPQVIGWLLAQRRADVSTK